MFSAVFHQISSTNDVYQWNSIIRELIHTGLSFLFQNEKQSLSLDKHTFPSMINGYTKLLDHELKKVVQDHVLHMDYLIIL